MSYLAEQQQKANENLEKTTFQSRLEDRTLWDKLLTVVLGILGFSFTLFSTDFLSSRLTCSNSKYLLLLSWISYGISLFAGFFLLKKETDFQRRESLRNTLYATDTSELLDSRTLQVKEDKKEHFIALQILRGKSIGRNEFWSKSALDMFEKHKKELNSYQLINNPDNLYSITDRKIIKWTEMVFYFFVIIATFFLMLSVTTILI